MERTCKTCVYRDRHRCCIDPPHILGINDDGKQIQKDPVIHEERIACKWHMTSDQREDADTIRMA